MRPLALLGHVARDGRQAGRAIAATPGLAAVIVVSLAVGIGANTAVFSWIQARLLHPIPGVARGAEFLAIEARTETGGNAGLSWPEYRDLIDRVPSFREVVAYRLAPLSVGATDWADRTYGVLVSGNYFSALGLQPAAGRLIAPADAIAPGRDAVVVVSEKFWRARLGGAPDAVGAMLRVNDRPFTIVGVAPAGFRGTVMGLASDVWVPATAVPLLLDGSRELENRSQRGYLSLGDLRPGAGRADAARDVEKAMQELAVLYPDSNAAITGAVVSQWQTARGPQQSLTTALGLLQGVMLLVLVAVAGNMTNLLLARTSARRSDVAIRLALGAGRWRIVSLLVTESLLLSTLGALLGAALAVWGTNALRAVPLPTPGGLELTFDTRVDLVSLAFALGLGAIAGLVIGLPPALHLSRTSPGLSTRAGGASAGRSTLRDAALALEVALAMVVLVASAMFIKSLADARTSDPGFRQDGVLLAAYDLRGRQPSVASDVARDFTARLIDRLEGVPGVESAAIAVAVPLDIHGMPARMFSLEGRARPDGTLDRALTNAVTPGYFDVMGIPLLRGTGFADLRDPSAPAQAIVNEAFGQHLLDGADPIGRRIDTGGQSFVIVGVVRDSVCDAFGEATPPVIYVSLRDRPAATGEMHVRTRAGSESALAPALRAAVRELNDSLPLYNVRTLGEHVDANLVFRKIPARIFAVLGPFLLALVGVGIYAVAAHSVASRRREIGVRLALGAAAGSVAALFVRDTLRTVAVGAAGGVAVAAMIDVPSLGGRAVQAALLAGVAAVLVLTAAGACWMSSRRACRIDPLLALRSE